MFLYLLHRNSLPQLFDGTKILGDAQTLEAVSYLYPISLNLKRAVLLMLE
jgi:hypothetical protein